eukprot:1668288-Alexandrium_andersonii.AAC.1
MTAKDVCTVAFLATQAGAVGVRDLALDPASPGDHFAEHVRKATGSNLSLIHISEPTRLALI